MLGEKLIANRISSRPVEKKESNERTRPGWDPACRRGNCGITLMNINRPTTTERGGYVQRSLNRGGVSSNIANHCQKKKKKGKGDQKSCPPQIPAADGQKDVS